MGDLVEGRNAVREALASPRGVSEILIAEGVRPVPVLQEIRTLAVERGVRVSEVPRADLDVLSARGAHQGVVARVAPFAYVGIEELVAPSGRPSLVFVLDHVTDPGNLGAVARSVEAFGADGIVIPKKRAAQVDAVAQKSSAGALSRLPVASVPNIVRALDVLKEAGYWVVGASEHGDEVSRGLAFDDRCVVVLGSEGSGLARLTRESCDHLVRIPLSGETPSLNVAQAATVFAYEWAGRPRDGS
jgi:23S rRNA (guanosine2251-2'-O)-methyltransferase